jgi:NADH-quinone oxidoreductase subunit L
MTAPLVVLAAGALLAGFVGIPAALGGSNAIERFLEPSFVAAPLSPSADAAVAHEGEAAGAHASRGLELGLMGLSVLVAMGGVGLAWRLYVVDPDASARLAARHPAAYRVLSGKYFVDELYNRTIVEGTMAMSRGLWTFDRRIVDGAVNGSSWMTLFGSWMSGLTDRAVVDGAVNAIGSRLQAASYGWRRLQTGLVQNYALVMLFGVFAFVSLYIIVR